MIVFLLNKSCHFRSQEEGRFISFTSRIFYKNWATDLGHHSNWRKLNCLLNADKFFKFWCKERQKIVSTRRDIFSFAIVIPVKISCTFLYWYLSFQLVYSQESLYVLSLCGKSFLGQCAMLYRLELV